MNEPKFSVNISQNLQVYFFCHGGYAYVLCGPGSPSALTSVIL